MRDLHENLARGNGSESKIEMFVWLVVVVIPPAHSNGEVRSCASRSPVGVLHTSFPRCITFNIVTAGSWYTLPPYYFIFFFGNPSGTVAAWHTRSHVRVLLAFHSDPIQNTPEIRCTHTRKCHGLGWVCAALSSADGIWNLRNGWNEGMHCRFIRNITGNTVNQHCWKKYNIQKLLFF